MDIRNLHPNGRIQRFTDGAKQGVYPANWGEAGQEPPGISQVKMAGE